MRDGTHDSSNKMSYQSRTLVGNIQVIYSCTIMPLYYPSVSIAEDPLLAGQIGKN